MTNDVTSRRENGRKPGGHQQGKKKRVLTFVAADPYHTLLLLEWLVQVWPVDPELEWLRARQYYAGINNGIDTYWEHHLVGALYVHKEDSISGEHRHNLPRCRWVSPDNIGTDPSAMSYRDSMVAHLERQLAQGRPSDAPAAINAPMKTDDDDA